MKHSKISKIFEKKHDASQDFEFDMQSKIKKNKGKMPKAKCADCGCKVKNGRELCNKCDNCE